jgi:hypothetical protein
LSKNMAVMRFRLVHFQESSSWEPLNGFEWNFVWMFLWGSLTSFDSFWVIYEFQNDHLCRLKCYWKSMGNNIVIIFSRNTQHNTTKLGTFVNCMCWVNKEVKENNNNNNKKSNLGLLYTNPGSTDNNLKGETT